MFKTLASLQTMWCSCLAASGISESTDVSLSLFIAGIVGTAAILYRAGRDRQMLTDRLNQLDSRITELSRNCRAANCGNKLRYVSDGSDVSDSDQDDQPDTDQDDQPDTEE